MSRLKLFDALRPRGGAAFTQCESFSATSRLDLTNAAKQGVYSPEPGKNAVVVSTVLRDFSGAPASAQVSLGWNAGADDFKENLSLVDAGCVMSELGLPSVPEAEMSPALLRALATAGTAGQTFGVKVIDPEGGPMTCAVDVFGYLY